MGKKLLPDQMDLYNRIDEILWKYWDPIGVSDIAEARNEYYSYLPHIFRLALEGADAERIATSLIATIESNMGLTANKEHNLDVAERIIGAKRLVIDKKKQ